MTNIRVLLLLIISFISYADDHESDENLGFILMSTYEMAYGSKYADLEKNLISEAKAGVMN